MGQTVWPLLAADIALAASRLLTFLRSLRALPAVLLGEGITHMPVGYLNIHHHVLIAALLGTALGLEREIRGKDPSLRTFCFITMGSCIFALLSVSVAGHPGADPSRVTAQIVSGVGFLGAGAIFRSPRGISGLTTAAMMWVAAAIGAAVGMDQVALAVVATIYVLVFSLGLNLLHEIFRYFKKNSSQSS
ncbi:MAG: MgtC/SapB family protein [Proteobacteria bacterium]|nr:MgtC/SapB family protein [Pseudomonadota bacterium]